MLKPGGRNQSNTSASVAEGWSIHRLTPPSRLYGANGLRTGADGRVYVAQVAGSQVSAVDPDSGEIEVISPMGGPIIGPDDLVFDDEGNLYCTEISEGRVSMLAPDGTSRVIQGDMPVANPITFHQGHLIAGECRPGGRIMELDRNGGAPRMILENAPAPNAFTVGPDGKLYFPAMATNEIWRISLDGGEPEVVAKDLGLPDSVKFDSEGFIVSTQVASGQVLRIDPRTGDKTVLADLGPGLDNCTFVGDRLFVSSIQGSLTEITAGGKVEPLIKGGLQWPLDLAVSADGVLFIADGGFTYTLRAGEEKKQEGMLFSPGFPGFTRGVDVVESDQYIVTTANGDLARWRPAQGESEVLASGYDQLMAVRMMPDGSAVFAEYATGRVLVFANGEASELATGLAGPKGIALGRDGTVYVGESDGGRVVRLSGGKAETVIDGLGQPEGIALHDGRLYVVDAGAKELIEFDLASGSRRAIATGLPVGAPLGVEPPALRAFMPLCGAMTSFTGVTVGGDGTIYLSADAEGSVLTLKRD